MPDATELQNHERAVWAAIDRDHLVETAMRLVDVPSPTGSEAACARTYRDILADAGMDVCLQEIEPERFNTVGRLAGRGGGPTLMFNGHLDTSWFGPGRELPDRPGYRPEASLDDGWLYGLGIYNMKGALACYAAAVRAIGKAGVPLAGSIIVAGVAGEVELAPVGEHQGGCFRGAGVGSRWLVTHGVTADLAVFGEPSALRLVPGHMGYAFARIWIDGAPAHGVYARPSDNAVLKMARLMLELQAWGERYERRHVYRDLGAKVTIGAVGGGTPFRTCRMPLQCSIYVDIRMTPAQRPIEVRDELEAVLREIGQRDPGTAIGFEIYVSNPGVEIPDEHVLTRTMAEAHLAATGTPATLVAEGWSSDAVHLCCYGVPGLNYGPSGRTRSGADGWDPRAGEHVAVEDLVTATRVYASTALRLCLASRDEVVGNVRHLPWIVRS